MPVALRYTSFVCIYFDRTIVCLLSINFHKFDREVKLRTDSPTYLFIHGEGAGDAPKPRKQLPPPQEGPPESRPVFPTAQPGQQGDDGTYLIVALKYPSSQSIPIHSNHK